MGNPKRWSARAATLLLVGVIAACSGGGGGGDGNSAGSGGDTPLTYTGKTAPAVITTTNAAQLTANIVGGTEASGAALSSVTPPAQSGGIKELDRRLIRAIRTTPSVSSSIRQLRSDPVDTTFNCDNVGSGTERIFGDVGQSGPGTLNFVWTNCLSGDATLNGSASMTVRVFDQNFGILDGTFNFVRVSLTSPTVSGTVSGPLQLQVDPAGNSEITKSNLITLDANGRMTKADDLEVKDVFDNISNPTSYVETIKGGLFDSVEGFVSIVTNTPLAFGTLTQPFANGGQLLLTGANKGQVRVVAVSSNVVELDLDLDGDNTFELTAFLKWTELTAQVASNLADSDGDHMHDSWERANGLNPNDPLDASADTDMDGANNLAEYRAGTDPKDPASHP